jgi:phosphatidylglycerophosphate synthase
MFARKISIYFSWFFILFKIKTFPVVLLMWFTGIIGTYLFTFGSYWYYIAAVLALQFWFILDHVDGELARYWKETSTKGIFKDKITHHLVHPLIFLFMGIGMYHQFNNPLMLIFGGFTVYFLLLQDLINIDKREAIAASQSIKSKINLNEKITLKNKLFKKFTELVYKIPGMMNIITIAAIANLLYYIFLFYAITFPIMIILKIIYNLSIPDNKFN